MMWIIWDGPSLDHPYVGPFASQEEAQAWVDEAARKVPEAIEDWSIWQLSDPDTAQATIQHI